MKLTSRSWLAYFLAFAGVSISTAEERISFNRQVRPLFSNTCFACHGFDAKERKADLRLDVPEGAFADLGGYSAIVPGDAEASEVWKRLVSTDEDEVMPPPDFHHVLTAEEKEIIRRWIDEGAEYQTHWSFVEPEKTAIPAVDGIANPIDLFLQERLKKEGLQPAEEANKETLIRRVTLDLTGLPPTNSEVDAFLADKSPSAFETLVDGLLGRETYGEHMARYWLDLARYADTHGLHLDNERSMWPYRDWVVQALNANLPFDEFTRWQLAGDLLPDPTREQLIASGFNRCNVTTSEGGSIAEEWVYRYAVDRTTTTVEVWMGLTAGCAVCHDHKFDPISAKDYYSMYSFFHSAADPAMDGNKIDTPPILKLTSDEDETRLAELNAKIEGIDERISAKIAELTYVDPATLDPAPALVSTEEVWFEDDFPEGAKPQVAGDPLRWVTKGDGEVFSGNRALIRSANATVAQDFFSSGASFTVPAKGVFFVHAFLDPADPPEAIMLQFHTDGWKHRAVWGAEDKIGFGKLGTPEKVAMGALPKAGEWVRLEIPVSRLELKAGTEVSGFAFTQYGGNVSWDRLGISSETNPAKDQEWSWKVWTEQKQGKRNAELPDDLRDLVRGKKAEEWSENERKRLRTPSDPGPSAGREPRG